MPRTAILFATICLISLFSGATASGASISVQDDSGHVVTLPAPAQRIVSLAPHVTELLFDIGAGGQIVAASDYSDYPEAAKRLPRVGGVFGLDLERIAAARPDLVIAWQSGASAAQLETIERLGIPVFRSEPKQLDDIATSLERFGALSGHALDAAIAASEFRAQVVTLGNMYSGKKPVRVFYQVWNAPLMTIGGPHLIAKVIKLCGGVNVFDRLDALAPVVDAEAVIAADPQVIVGASASGGDERDLAIWRRWPRIAAVRNRHLVVLDAAIITRHTPRILIGARQLCDSIDAARRDR